MQHNLSTSLSRFVLMQHQRRQQEADDDEKEAIFVAGGGEGVDFVWLRSFHRFILQSYRNLHTK